MTSWHPDMPEEYRNQIMTGDARELAKRIPDESIDLIFTDPVYQNIDDYRWLAETAVRVLRPGAACLAFVNSKWVTRVLALVHTDNPLLSLTLRNGPAPMNGRVIAKTHYVVWFGANDLVGYMPDNWHTQRPWSEINGHNHEWTKDPNYIKTVFEAFTLADAIVYDPFTGGGTVPAVCKTLGRNYVASEIDPDTAERARQRVLNTQSPLFVLQPQ